MDKDRYIGRLLDNRYEILEVIGTGGMAVVYKARCHRLNRLVAIKILKDEYSRDEEFRRRFHAESQAVAMLSHPNIVSVYDVSTSDDADFIVMELIDGITLKQYMVKKGILNWKETLHFAIQIGKALDHAHSRGIIHRDIKPHNVMVLKNGSVKVADFGIARVMSQSNTLTKEALGSVHYISPEQAKGGRVDNRSDIYSLGVVMYEMMTGRPPYDGDSPVSIAIQHINGKAQMPSALNPNIPGGLEQIIVKAMEQEPGKRFATVSAMLRDMDEFRKDPTILFDYNNPVADLDAAANLSNTSKKEAETEILPVKPVQRAVSQTSGTKPRTQASGQKPVRTARRRRDEEIVDDEDRGGVVATVAIIACVLVALVAIGIFVWAFMQGNDEVIQVPNLIGMTKVQWEQVTDVTVIIKESKYHDTVPSGQVYDQAPSPNSQIAKGGTVSIYISLGPKPETAKMPKLTDMTEEAAVKYLTESMGIDKNKINIISENSATVEKGKVTRTEPAADEALKDNQDIRIWVSAGPEAKTARVPNVYGYSADMAFSLLKANGFDNVRFESVESTRDRDTVVHQSVEANTVVDVTTEIVLQISIGGGEPGPTEPPVDPELVTKVITVELPEEAAEDYILSIWQDENLIEEREIFAGTISTQFELTGKGVVTYTLMIDSANYWTIEVNFNE